MTKRLEGLENVLAVELSFAPLLSDDIVLLAIEMCQGELPVIIGLAPEQVLRIGSRAMKAGAAAVSLAPPRGSLGRGGDRLSGRLFGPAVLPGSLEVIRSAAGMGLTCIGAGGLFTEGDVEAMLEAGASAVQIDTALWLPREKIESLAA